MLTPLSFPCPKAGCSRTSSLVDILSGATNSLPQKSQILFTCPACGDEFSLWMGEGKIRASESGPATDIPGFHVYVDETYGMDCVYQGRLYHMPKRREVI